MSHAAGETIDGRYELRRVICAGEEGELYEARHLHTQRTVAVQLLSDAARQDEEERARIGEEARVRTRARHRCVVAVFDAGEAGPDDPYLVTEMHDGRTLDGLLASRGSLMPADALPIALAACEALACAHARGVIHGSLTPASILLPTPTVDPWLIESGEQLPAAKLLDMGRAPPPQACSVGFALGGFGYSPSEQLLGGEPDALCDVYTMGAIVFECLTGRLPGADGSTPALGGILSRTETQVPLAEVVLSALGPREERPGSMMEMLRALRDALTRKPPPKSEPPPRRRRKPRASYVTPVYVARRGQPRTQWICQDISEGGLLIVGPRGITTGEKVQVRFTLPRSGQDATLTAMVRWVRPARDDKVAMGIEFIGVPATSREDISVYVAFYSQDGA